jgi:hypothetical protein
VITYRLGEQVLCALRAVFLGGQCLLEQINLLLKNPAHTR